MFGRLSTLAMAGAASLTAYGGAVQAQMNLSQPPAQGQTQTCAFRDGPRAGQTIDYSGAPGAAPARIGARCADMQGSSGVAVSPATARQQGEGRYYTSPGAPSAWSPPGNPRRGYSQSCRFTMGPRMGSTVDYSRTLGAEPIVIGAPCAEGESSGVAVAPSGR